MNTSNFENWFAKQIEAGLVDIKFAINAGKGITNEAVQEEILGAEAAITAGFLRKAPIAMSTTPDNISAILRNSKLEAAAV